MFWIFNHYFETFNEHWICVYAGEFNKANSILYMHIVYCKFQTVFDFSIDS